MENMQSLIIYHVGLVVSKIHAIVIYFDNVLLRGDC